MIQHDNDTTEFKTTINMASITSTSSHSKQIKTMERLTLHSFHGGTRQHGREETATVTARQKGCGIFPFSMQVRDGGPNAIDSFVRSDKI